LAAFFNRVKAETGKKLSPKNLAAQFKSVTFAEWSEKVTETTCDMSAHLLEFDSDMGIDIPLDSIGKLVTICAKAMVQSQTVKDAALMQFLPEVLFKDALRVSGSSVSSYCLVA